jgi:hypothetical protein
VRRYLADRAFLETPGVRERTLGAQSDDGVDPGVGRLDTGQRRLDEFHRRDLAPLEQSHRFSRGQPP